MKNPNETAVLRTKLRNVNIEYSALVRTDDSDGKVARLRALDMQRHALMARLFGASNDNGEDRRRGSVRTWMADRGGRLQPRPDSPDSHTRTLS